jgi:hypothetical protein
MAISNKTLLYDSGCFRIEAAAVVFSPGFGAPKLPFGKKDTHGSIIFFLLKLFFRNN